MSRPRKTKRDPLGNTLLPRMYFRHGAYYLVELGGRWLPLGRDYVEAVRAYGIKIAARAQESMGALVEDWKKEQLGAYAASTQTDYRRMCDVIDAAFVDFRVVDVTPADVYAFCAQWKTKPRTANMYRSLLAMVFTYGASTSWPNENPARQSMTFKKGKKRDRYLTDDEVQRIIAGARVAADGLKNRSGPMVAAAIELAYQTGQRIGDILALRLSDLTDEGIFFYPSKTRNNTGVKLVVTWTPKLREIVDACKAYGSIKGLHLVRRLDGKPLSYSGFHSAWSRACARAGVEDAHIHDLKAKSLTDTEDVREAQKRGGHATESQTAHYRKSRTVTRVKPVSGG